MTDLRTTKRLLQITLLVVGLVAALRPVGALAHVRWFTDEDRWSAEDWSRFWSLPVLVGAVTSAIAVGALILLRRAVDDPLWPRPPMFQRLEPAAPAILGVQTAVAVIFAATRLDLFAPNIDLPRNVLGFLFATVAVVASFTFITGVLPRVGAVVMIALVLLIPAFSSVTEMLEQVLFIGIALYLAAVGRGVVRYDERTEEDRTHLFDRLLPHSLTILRVFTAVSIITLAFTEKLINPDLGVAFLQDWPKFNVGRELGIDWFTDHRFVLMIGIIELTAGIALLSGLMNRVVILALWVPFNLGIPFLPPQEMLGHLPILAAMYVLLVRGTEGIPSKELSPTPGEAAQRPASDAAPAVEPRTA